jgi:hypothetical protein
MLKRLVLTLRMKVVSTEHPSTLYIMYNLARMHELRAVMNRIAPIQEITTLNVLN